MYLTTSLNSVLFDKMYSMQVSNANVSRPSHSATEGWAGAKPCGGAHCLMEPEDGDKESKKDSPKLGPSPFSLLELATINSAIDCSQTANPNTSTMKHGGLIIL